LEESQRKKEFLKIFPKKETEKKNDKKYSGISFFGSFLEFFEKKGGKNFLPRMRPKIREGNLFMKFFLSPI